MSRMNKYGQFKFELVDINLSFICKYMSKKLQDVFNAN
jgi:hypothetical protein